MPSPTISGLILEDLMASLGFDKISLFSDFLKSEVFFRFCASWLLPGTQLQHLKIGGQHRMALFGTKIIWFSICFADTYVSSINSANNLWYLTISWNAELFNTLRRFKSCFGKLDVMRCFSFHLKAKLFCDFYGGWFSDYGGWSFKSPDTKSHWTSHHSTFY